MIEFSKAMEQRLKTLNREYDTRQMENGQRIVIPIMDRVDLAERAILMKIKTGEEYNRDAREALAKELATVYPTTAPQRWKNFLDEASNKLSSLTTASLHPPAS